MTHDHFSHVHPGLSTSKRLALAIGLTLVFIVAELVAGIFSKSLALLTDAVHNVTDVIALGLTWWAFWITTKPAHSKKTYGYHRAGILIALVNSTTLVIISIGIFYEAYQRLVKPQVVVAPVMIGVGVLAILINLITAFLVRQGSKADLNLKSAFVHLMGDVFSTLGAVVAGILIQFTGNNWLDPLASILIGLLILWNAWSIVRESVDILMEATPLDIQMDQLRDDILSVTGVKGVHDLHVWSISKQYRTISAHVVVDDMLLNKSTKTRYLISNILRDKYKIEHITLQFECLGCQDDSLYCNLVQDGISHK